jgi:UDP-glucuronate 4-epimerase
MRYLVTGDAGFIGFHVARRLLEAGHDVLGIDNLNPYYDVSLKERRRAILTEWPGYEGLSFSIEEMDKLLAAFRRFAPEVVIHLAAQAGVRHSLEFPRDYVNANIIGSFNVLEAVRLNGGVKHLLLASTSSAYGANTHYPFVEQDKAVHPVTIYAASKGAMELMAHSYAHLYATPTTAFRFFTVYGPWGRPDMAYSLFTRAILAGEPISVFNHGDCWRDFTYIDDLVTSILDLAALPPPAADAREGFVQHPADTLSPAAPYRLVNIGAGRPAKLTDFIAAIERALGQEAVKIFKPLPPGDMVQTFADATLLEHLTGRKPGTPLDEGLRAFVAWYRTHRN